MWETVGIPETEAQVYEALISRGHSTADVLSSRVNITTARTTRALASLIQRGLVTRAPGRPARYSAVEPSLAGSVLIAKREHELRRLQQHLNKLDEAFHAEKSANRLDDHIEVIRGAPKIWRTFVRVQRRAQQEVRAFDKPPYFVAAGEHGDEGPNLEERRFLEAGTIGYRVVYDQESVAIPGRLENIWEGIKRGERAKVGTSLPVKLVMCDDTLAIISSAADYHNGVAYLIRPSSLLDMTAALFEAVWSRAVPLNRSGPTGSQATMSSRDRQLLGLLASGATDEVIARTFGWSIRTVQRHIHELMQQVGARTRFQIGMEAARRGWL
ncbi:regulatory protein, luxR family [Actinacidiphila yanglinensis]|uniref:Regulatory protein, luxR family n=1 Tax=Actinacidiphila yanglinensis TaxID=310779 RepID=A0A1H5S6J2_9ACTN|nr:helix-turn-helix domain-containing protein [Actinacidiphila yanglinensis]SEF46225.1 regulatory protein, luxR family [Actinacidiphila yanglinensis]